MLLGLDFGVHIHRLRVVRQMGLRQLISQDLTVRQVPLRIGGLDTDQWAFGWRERTMWRVPDVRATTVVSEAYRRWVRISDLRDHDRL